MKITIEATSKTGKPVEAILMVDEQAMGYAVDPVKFVIAALGNVLGGTFDLIHDDKPKEPK